MGPTVKPALLPGSAVLFQLSEPVPPAAAPEEAPEGDQARLVLWVVWMLEGTAVKDGMVGVGAAVVAVTVSVAGALVPPGPVQVKA